VRLRTKVLGVAIVSAALVGGFATAAFAAEAYSPPKVHGPYSGASYISEAHILTTSTNVHATSVVERVSGSMVANEVRLISRSHTPNGAVCQQSNQVGSANGVFGLGVTVSGHCGIDHYYSLGEIDFLYGPTKQGTNPTIHVLFSF
jgi:hypothetical protein